MSTYAHIANDIMGKIRNGEYAMNTPLPGRNALKKNYGVAYGTVDRAIRLLVEQGILRAKNGQGTFVSVPPNELHSLSRRAQSMTATSAPPPSGKLSRPATIAIMTNTDPARPIGWYSTLTHSLETACAAAGGTTRLIDRCKFGGLWPDSFDKAVVEAASADVDACIVIGLNIPLTLGERVLDRFDLQATPVVCITWHAIAAPVPHVYYDNRNSGYSAGSHLLRGGYRRIIYVAVHQSSWERERAEGIKDALRGPGATDASLEIISSQASIVEDEQIDPIVQRLLSENMARVLPTAQDGAPVAIVGSNDAVARVAFDYIEKAGFRPGADIGVLGFDDKLYSRDIGLTSVRPPLEEMGTSAVNMAVDALNRDLRRMQICCSAEAIARLSTLRRD